MPSLCVTRRFDTADPLWSELWKPGCPNQVIEIISQSFDPDRVGVGSSPRVGDMGAPGVRVPAAPTTGQTSRYLFSLAAIEVPGGCGIVIRGLRQAITLRAEVEVSPATESADATYRIFELEQTSPFWAFQDGNVSWHLMWRPNKMSQQRIPTPDLAPMPGQSPDMRTMSTALIYRATSPYIPMGAGIPPGSPVGDMGAMYGINYPWNTNPSDSLSVPILGPGVVQLWASVKQTNPETRVSAEACTYTQGVRPEDAFVQTFPTQAVYGRIAGSMLVELFPGGCNA